MVAIIERELCRRSVDLDRPRPLVGHVAVDTVRDHSRPDPRGHLVPADLMTPEALPRKPRQISFRFMDVVASRTGHRRAGAKALAAPQQPDLIAMNVRHRPVLVRRREEKVVEALAGSI